jgi:hypothetical protein
MLVRIIKRLQAKPAAVRDRYALAAAGSITAVVCLLWVNGSLGGTFGDVSGQAATVAANNQSSSNGQSTEASGALSNPLTELLDTVSQLPQELSTVADQNDQPAPTLTLPSPVAAITTATTTADTAVPQPLNVPEASPMTVPAETTVQPNTPRPIRIATTTPTTD